ncbi:MAG: TPM domain-containing protein [Cyclobacteriaceae bacterium]|nr:TPM domain-containing protein [Cyclobacteriaceae bacterium]
MICELNSSNNSTPFHFVIQMRLSFTYSLLALSLLVTSFTFAQIAVPAHEGRWVHDEAHVLSPSTVAQLEQVLKAERDSTSNQIAILIVPTLDGEDIEGFGIRVAEAWKAGSKENDNGVIFIIAIQERKMRIEVGQGLEGVLTDALSSRINRNEVAPQFRQGNYDAGVAAGTMAIIQAIKGTYKGDGPVRRSKRGGKSPLTTIIIIIIIIIIMSRRGGGAGGYWAAGSLLGGGFGGGGSSSWDNGSDYGGGGSFGGGGSSDSW